MKPTQINPDCDSCKLCESANTICLRGKGGSHTPLMVFTDYPDYFADRLRRPYAEHTGKLLDWLFAKMSVDPAHVTYDYTLHCYPRNTLPSTKAGRSSCIEECSQYRFATIAKVKPRAIVALGQCSLEAFTGKTKVGEYQGRKITAWEGAVREVCDKIWVGYSIAYLLKSPSDSPSVYRVLFAAALDAGLKPKPCDTIKPFIWDML